MKTLKRTIAADNAHAASWANVLSPMPPAMAGDEPLEPSLRGNVPASDNIEKMTIKKVLLYEDHYALPCSFFLQTCALKC